MIAFAYSVKINVSKTNIFASLTKRNVLEK